ncbi:MAG: hydrogenase maturation protease [Bacillota bacterium]
MILGIGNIFCKDDGIGSVMARKLVSTFHGKGEIDVIDGGTTGLGLLYLFAEYSRIIVIDAVDMQGEPGEVFIFSPDDLEHAHPHGIVSTHQPGVLQLLNLGKAIGVLPEEILILGVQVKELGAEYGLSAELQEKLPVIENKLSEAIVSHLS